MEAHKKKIVWGAAVVLLMGALAYAYAHTRSSRAALSFSCPLTAGQFVGRIISKEKPFAAEILDYSLESENGEPLNNRPAIIDGAARVADTTDATMGDIVLGRYSQGFCGGTGGELASCSYVEILAKGGEPGAYCNSEKDLKYVNRKNEVVVALTDYDERSLLAVRANGEVQYADYWGKAVSPRNIKKEEVQSLIESAHNPALRSSVDASNSGTSVHKIVIALNGRFTYIIFSNDFTGRVPRATEELATKILELERNILTQSGYTMKVKASYPLLEWKGQKSFSGYVGPKNMIDYQNDLTAPELKEIHAYYPDLAGLLKKHGKVFFKEGARIYEVVVYDSRPDVPVGHEQEEATSGFYGFSYWQEQDIDLKSVPSEGVGISEEVVKRNKIQLQPPTDRFIIQGDAVFELTIERI